MSWKKHLILELICKEIDKKVVGVNEIKKIILILIPVLILISIIDFFETRLDEVKIGNGKLIKTVNSPDGKKTVELYLINPNNEGPSFILGRLEDEKKDIKNIYHSYRESKVDAKWIDNNRIMINNRILDIRNETYNWVIDDQFNIINDYDVPMHYKMRVKDKLLISREKLRKHGNPYYTIDSLTTKNLNNVDYIEEEVNVMLTKKEYKVLTKNKTVFHHSFNEIEELHIYSIAKERSQHSIHLKLSKNTYEVIFAEKNEEFYLYLKPLNKEN